MCKHIHPGEENIKQGDSREKKLGAASPVPCEPVLHEQKTVYRKHAELGTMQLSTEGELWTNPK